MRYGYALTDECPLYRMPDSCTHIAEEYPDHDALRINRHNVACQLIHAAIRKTFKGGGALHITLDLVMVMADTGTHAMITGDSIESLFPTAEDTNLSPTTETPPHDWFAPLPTSEEICHRSHTDVSHDPRYHHWGLSAADGDDECTAAPRRIPDWVLPHGETHMLFDVGHGTAQDLIYARGVPDYKSMRSLCKMQKWKRAITKFGNKINYNS